MNDSNSSHTLVDETNPTPLLSSVISALSTEATPFTGERFVFGSGVEIFYEHYHRYVFAARAIDSTQTVLDLGCGIGYGSLILASKAKKVVAIDRDPDSIALLKSLASQLGVHNVEAICGDVASLDTAIPDPIDVVVCHELIEHLPQPLQESLVRLIASGNAPFHASTKLLVSTPERNVYNQKNKEHNDFHEFEFSHAEFKQILSKNFQHVSLFWQGSITGNALVAEQGGANSVAAGFVHWQDMTKLLGTVTDIPERHGVFMYGIASNAPLNPISSSILVDQRERLFMEKLAIAAQELNQTEFRVNKLREENDSLRSSLSIDRQTQQKVKDLLRENEILGARHEEAHRYFGQRISEYEAIIQAHVNSPLEVKLAKKCMEKMPTFIRKIIRRIAAVGLALVRG